MDPCETPDIMHLQDPIPAALDLSIRCKGSHLDHNPMEALDLVKKPSWYEVNTGSNNRTCLPENTSDFHNSQPGEQSNPETASLEPAQRLSYGPGPCARPSLSPHSVQLTSFNGLHPVTDMQTQSPATDQLVTADGSVNHCIAAEQHFVQLCNTPPPSDGRGINFMQQADESSLTVYCNTVERGPGGSSNSTCVQGNVSHGVTQNGAVCTWNSGQSRTTRNSIRRGETPSPPPKGSVAPQDSSCSASGSGCGDALEDELPATPSQRGLEEWTPPLLSQPPPVSVTVILEDSSASNGHSVVSEHTDVISVPSESSCVDGKSCIEYISSDDSDVVEVSVSNRLCNSYGQTKDTATNGRNPEAKLPRCSAHRVPLEADARDGTATENAHTTNELDSKIKMSSNTPGCDSVEANRLCSTALHDSDAETNPNCVSFVPSTSNAENMSVAPPDRSPHPAARQTVPASHGKKPTKSRPKRKRPAKPAADSPHSSCAAKRRRKKPRPSGPSSMFPPQEPEIKLKYANYKEDRRDGRGDSFAPYVHVERRDVPACCVVNFQDEDDNVRTKRGPHPATPSPAVGLIPKTSCLQLGRLSSVSKGGGLQRCCLCGRAANEAGLGDLHGPYFSCGPSKAFGDPSAQGRERDCSDAESVCSADRGGRGGWAEGPRGVPPPAGRVRDAAADDADAARDLRRSCGGEDWPTGVRWVHEDCSVWSTGVFLIKGKLYGLDEAVRLAQGTVCSCCSHAGATLGCFFKGCHKKYHFPCALESECGLNEENFTIRCSNHKNKAPRTSVNRLKTR